MTQVSFFQSVAKFAKPFSKDAARAERDPIQQAWARFTAAAKEAVKEINEGKDKCFWFRKIGDGFVVHLKNGPKVLHKCSFAVGTKADAAKLLVQAVVARGEGESDEQFKATARPRKPMHSADPKLNAPAAAQTEVPA